MLRPRTDINNSREFRRLRKDWLYATGRVLMLGIRNHWLPMAMSDLHLAVLSNKWISKTTRTIYIALEKLFSRKGALSSSSRIVVPVEHVLRVNRVVALGALVDFSDYFHVTMNYGLCSFGFAPCWDFLWLFSYYPLVPIDTPLIY